MHGNSKTQAQPVFKPVHVPIGVGVVNSITIATESGTWKKENKRYVSIGVDYIYNLWYRS